MVYSHWLSQGPGKMGQGLAPEKMMSGLHIHFQVLKTFPEMSFSCFVAARKRSFGQNNVITPVCHSVSRDPPDRDPPGQRLPWTETTCTETPCTETPDKDPQRKTPRDPPGTETPLSSHHSRLYASTGMLICCCFSCT